MKTKEELADTGFDYERTDHLYDDTAFVAVVVMKNERCSEESLGGG